MTSKQNTCSLGRRSAGSEQFLYRLIKELRDLLSTLLYALRDGSPIYSSCHYGRSTATIPTLPSHHGLGQAHSLKPRVSAFALWPGTGERVGELLPMLPKEGDLASSRATTSAGSILADWCLAARPLVLGSVIFSKAYKTRWGCVSNE